MNNKLRFIVGTLLLLAVSPIVFLILWLSDELAESWTDYERFYQEAWRPQ